MSKTSKKPASSKKNPYSLDNGIWLRGVFLPWKYVTRRNIFLVSFIVPIAGIIIVITGQKYYVNANTISKYGIDTPGTVTKEYEGSGLSNFVTYSFTQEGSTIVHTDSVSDNYYASVHAGSKVNVVYDSQNPSKNYLVGFTPTNHSAKQTILAGVLVFGISLMAILIAFAIFR